MAYKDFINDFNKDLLGDVLFLYGAEDFLMEWALNQIIEKYVDEHARNLDVQYIDGDVCTASDIMSAARSFSMFSDKRIVVVRNYMPLYRKKTDVDVENLLVFAQEKQDASKVVFILESKYENDINAYGKKMIAKASSYDFARLDKASLKSFINKRIHNYGKIIGSRELDYLIDITGYYNRISTYSLSDYDKDIEKLCKASSEDQIQTGLIEELLVGQEDKYVFNLVETIMTGNKNKALELAEIIISEDDSSMMVMSLLTKQFEIMYDSLQLSKEGLSLKEIARKTGVNEYRLKRAYQSARNFNSDRLKDILIKMYNIDRDIKIGSMDKDVAFELLILSI